jgi:cobalt-precorrin 5A hydrolase
VRIAIVTINQPSLNSAQRLIQYLQDYEVDIYAKGEFISYDKLDDILPTLWREYRAIIFILAVGAVVRKVAPFLRDKTRDPAILVMNLALDKVLPLIGGHLGGANELSSVICSRVPNCINFISTATDQTHTLAFDMLASQRGWRILNIKALARVSNRLINGEGVQVATYPNIFNSIPNRENLKLVGFEDLDLNTVVISPILNPKHSLTLQPKLHLGIGCNRDTPMERIEEAFKMFQTRYGVGEIATLGTFEAKRDEVGLLEFAKKYGLPIKFFTKKDINSLQNSFSKSASTKFFGLKGVAEPSAILASEYGELVIKKGVYFNSITIAGAV